MNTRRTEWHVGDEDLAGYVSGALAPVLATSVETHLMGCEGCREPASPAPRTTPTSRTPGSASPTRSTGPRRPAGPVPARHGLLRSSIATPTMVAALLVGVVSWGGPAGGGRRARGRRPGGPARAAPLAPVAAAGLAYRDWSDPAGEISLATPSAGLPLVAKRALLVVRGGARRGRVTLLVVDVGRRADALSFSWCLPGLALSALVLLAGTTRVDPLHVAARPRPRLGGRGRAAVDGAAQPAPRGLPRRPGQPRAPEPRPSRSPSSPCSPRSPDATSSPTGGPHDHPDLGRILEIDQLTKSYGGTRPSTASPSPPGRGVIGLLGPNGAGKTTLLRMVATVLAPDSGDLRLLGLDPADPGERIEIRRRLGYLPQSPGLYPGFTPFDLVDYVAVLKEHTDRDWRREETRRVLESVGLADVMHQKIRRAVGWDEAARRAGRGDGREPRPARARRAGQRARPRPAAAAALAADASPRPC